MRVFRSTGSAKQKGEEITLHRLGVSKEKEVLANQEQQLAQNSQADRESQLAALREQSEAALQTVISDCEDEVNEEELQRQMRASMEQAHLENGTGFH